MERVTRERIQGEFLEIIAEIGQIAIHEIKTTDKLIDDLGLDSMGIMDAIASICERYNLYPEFEGRIRELPSIDNVVDFLMQYIEGAAIMEQSVRATAGHSLRRHEVSENFK